MKRAVCGRWGGVGMLLGLAAALGDAAAAPAEPASGATRADWAGDLAFFRRELPARHKNLFFATDRAVFERELGGLERDWPRLAESEVALRLQEITAALGDDHTAVYTAPLLAKLAPVPLGLHWFADGWRVLTTDRAHEKLLGRKLTALGGRPMAEVEARLARLLSPHHPWLVKARLPQIVPAPAVLRYCEVAGATLTATTVDDHGHATDAEFPFGTAALPGTPRVNFQPATPADAYAHQRDILRTKLLAADRIFYVQYNRCEGRETAERRGDRETAARLPSLQGLFDAALTELRAAVGDGRADTLVFDVRFNSGGASDFGTRFAQQVAKIGALRQPGRVYVVIGRRTFSSAILNALDFKRLLAARFVGEPTSGTANHYGEVRTFTLPSSRLVVGYSTKYFGEPGGRLDPLQPDIPAEMTFAEFNQGIDPVLPAIVRARALSSGQP